MSKIREELDQIIGENFSKLLDDMGCALTCIKAERKALDIKDILVDQILAYIKSQKVVRLRDNQELPFPNDAMLSRLNYHIDLMSPARGAVIEAYRLAQQDAGEANFKAVEELE